MANQIDQANLALAAIKERLERLKADLTLTQDAIRRAEAEYHRQEGKIAVLKDLESKVSRDEDNQGTRRHSKRPRVANPSRTKVADTAVAVIMDLKRPVPRNELFAEVTKRGIQINGIDPLMVFSTMLWRERERVIRIRGYGYWVADQAYPPAGFLPDREQPSLF